MFHEDMQAALSGMLYTGVFTSGGVSPCHTDCARCQMPWLRSSWYLSSGASNFPFVVLQVVDDILDITATTEELGKTAGKDLTSDKTTYPALLGLERSKEVAKELIDDAKDALAMYDDVKAAPLIGLADYILSRTN